MGALLAAPITPSTNNLLALHRIPPQRHQEALPAQHPRQLRGVAARGRGLHFGAGDEARVQGVRIAAEEDPQRDFHHFRPPLQAWMPQQPDLQRRIAAESSAGAPPSVCVSIA